MILRPVESLYQGQSAIKQKIDSSYLQNTAIWNAFWSEATIDARLEAGDISLNTQLSAQPNILNTGNYFFNRTRPLCSMVSGHQRRNRKSCIFVPMENGDQITADQMSKIMFNIFKRENVYETISDAFHQGACITGMNMLHVYLDFKNDPVNGDVKVDNLAYNQFFIDPYFRKLDLSDCAFVWRRTYLTHSAAAALMPAEYYDSIMALTGNPIGMGRDGRFQFQPEATGQTLMNKLAYDEYYYRDYREQHLIIDRNTGMQREVTKDQLDETDVDLMLAENPSFKIVKHTIPTVRLAIMIQDQVYYDGPQPTNSDFYPFVPVVGYYTPSLPYFYTRIQGICRALRDPQMLLNRRIMLSADLAESVVNSGYIFKESAVLDVKHLMQTGAGRIIPLKDDAQMTDIIPIQAPNIPPGFFQLQETFSKELSLVTGINEELMGMANDAKAGITEVLRQGAGLTTLEPLFDKLDSSQVLLGERIMDIVRLNYTPAKIRMMLEGQQPSPLFYNKDFGKYHCMVQLGFNTESQRQMQFAQLLQLRELGVQIPDSRLLEAATIQNKTEIMQEVATNAQAAQQMQQQQAQIAMQEMQARAELSQARAVADRGLGVERISRVAENQALAQERRAEAVKDDNQALLNYVKAMKEIESIDIAQLEKLIQLQRVLKELEMEDIAEQPVNPVNIGS